MFATPEEAAREEIPSEYVRTVAVIVRGDRAVVAQLTNADGYPESYEIETVHCSREGLGWVSEMSSNGNAAVIATGAATGTVMVWLSDAPPGAVAARFTLDDRQEVFPVEDGCVVAVFDDVPLASEGSPRDYPALQEWRYSANRS
jgi:hypothetical protein